MITRITTPYSYSSAVAAGDYVFLGLHRGFGENFYGQIHEALSHIKSNLQQLNVPMSNVVKVNVYLKNIQDLPEMEQVFCEFFEKDKFPARMTSTTEFYDCDCLIMIDGIAFRGSN